MKIERLITNVRIVGSPIRVESEGGGGGGCFWHFFANSGRFCDRGATLGYGIPS